MAAKQYGLILPNKNKNTQQNLGTRTLNPLLNSDDELENEEEENTLNWVESSLKRSSGNSGQKSLQKRILREALEEDSSIFQYDEVFDDMKAAQQQQKEKVTSAQKKPKYINTIVKHCEKRKLENERRQERKVQKEREAEGNEFEDKESFVTPSYLKKLKELKEAEEEEKKEKYLEEKCDVHKHKNFGVFYNHLFQQRVGNAEGIKQETPDDTDASASKETTFAVKNRQQDSKRNIRARREDSDDESPQQTDAPVKVKTEPESSSDAEQEHDSSSRTAEARRIRSPHRERGRDRSERQNSDKKRRRDSPQDSRRRRRSRSRSPRQEVDRRESPNRGRHQRDRQTKESRRNEMEDRGKDKETKESRRNEMDDRRNRHSENGRRQRSRSRERQRRERSVDKNKEERRKDERKVKDEDNPNKENVKTKGGVTDQPKQSINSTLGATDVNKMKMEERLKRFKEIFAKRTVGPVFEDAVRRYFTRKSDREAAGLL